MVRHAGRQEVAVCMTMAAVACRPCISSTSSQKLFPNLLHDVLSSLVLAGLQLVTAGHVVMAGVSPTPMKFTIAR